MGDYSAFFYGTLMVPGILHRVIYGSRTPEPWQLSLTTIRPALLLGYQRHKVVGADYPAIIPIPTSTSTSTTTGTSQSPSPSVRGTICTGLTSGDIHRLDHFEGSEYSRERVTALLLKDSIGFSGRVDESRLSEFVDGEVEVDVYVFKEEYRHLLEEKEWDFDEFMREKAGKWTGEVSVEGGEVDEFFEEQKDRERERGVEGDGVGKGVPLLEARAVNGS